MGIDLDRERVACVFGLGGGELHQAHPDFPDEWDGLIAYWYEGQPHYAALPDLGLDHDDEVRTAILDCLFGHPESPPGWRRVASFRSSGERECWWCGDGTGNEEHREHCRLCEGDGLIYLGEGWCEVVYARSV
jgi:hypothetical protein